MLSDYKALQINFKKRNKSGRIIKTIERWYKVKEVGEKVSNKTLYTLDQVLELYAQTTKLEDGYKINSDQSTHNQYREQYMKDRICSRKIPIAMILQSLWYAFGIFLGIFVFLKWFAFEIFDAVEFKYRILIYILSFSIGVGALYLGKYHPQIMTTLFGENQWIDVLEFYDNPKRYYRSIGSGRSNRFNNTENYDVYLSALLNGQNIDLIIEQRVYRNICDLKRIPVRVYKNKVYVNEIAVNIQSIEWRKKQ